MNRLFSRFAELCSVWTGRPVAFVISLAIVLVWAGTGRLFHYSDTWQLVINTGTTIITFLMVFVIQNSQNRDTAAIHSKLDELLRVNADARNSLIGLERRSDEEIDTVRKAIESDCRD